MDLNHFYFTVFCFKFRQLFQLKKIYDVLHYIWTLTINPIKAAILFRHINFILADLVKNDL